MKTEDIAFTASYDGSEQHYVRMLPPHLNVGKPQDVLIALHGHGADRWQMPREERDECRAIREAAAERGLVLISPDYRASTSWMGPAAESDLVDIIGNVCKEYRVTKVFLCGCSMGGASALTFTALHPGLVAGVAAMNGIANHLEFENFQDAIAASFGGTKEEIAEVYRKRSAAFHADAFTMPVGLTTSGRDTSTPPGCVQRLAEAIRKVQPNVLFIHRENEGHRTNHEDARAVLEFVMATRPKSLDDSLAVAKLHDEKIDR